MVQRRESLGRDGYNSGLWHSSAEAAPLRCAQRFHQSITVVIAIAEDDHAHCASKIIELSWGQMRAARQEGKVGREVLHEDTNALKIKVNYLK